MSGLNIDRPQEMSTLTKDRDVKGPDWTYLCSILIVALAVVTVYYMARKETVVCCNIAEELNITKTLAELQIRLKHIETTLEKEMKGDATQRRCKNGWIHFSNNCYYFSKEKDTWPMALLKCRDLGGYLLEINDAKENTFFKEQAKLLGGHVWMGGSDQLKDTDWIWVTSGTHFSGVYTDWAPGQPDDKIGRENCLDLRLDWYKWNDAPCSELNRYVCETAAD